MNDDNKILGVGYPDFWSQAQLVDPDYFDQIPKLIGDLNKIINVGESLPLAKVVQALAKMVWDSQNAVAILCLNGHGLDAIRLVRCSFEGAVTAAYLVKRPDELDDYVHYAKISRKLLLDFADQYPSPGVKAISQEARAAALANYEAVRSRYENKDGKLRATWCCRPFRQMIAEIGLDSMYPGFYHFASSAAHMNARGLYMQHGIDPDGEILQSVAPTLKWIDTALAASRLSIRTALEAYQKVTGFEAVRSAIHVTLENFMAKPDKIG